jgi:DNA polymerase
MSNYDKLHKHEALHRLKDEMEMDDLLPLKKGATRLVFGSGNTEAKILLCGEGPGRQEDLQGLPFVGPAGKLLDKLLILAGLERKKVFITNVVHHRPPNNRDPEPNEISAYGKYLDKIIKIIDPKVIITLGRFSMAKFLPNVFISQVHGKDFKVGNFTIIPMYHPAASLRNGNILRQEQQDFLEMGKLLPEILDPKDDKVVLEQKSLV